MKKGKAKQHCFIESKRPCTLKCKAGYEEGGKTQCTILWSLTQSGWAFLKKGIQVYKDLKKKKKR